MRKIRIMSLVLALLMVAACFIGCGNETTDTTRAPETDAPDYVDDGTVTNTQNRHNVKDNVPTDLRFDGEEMVFFVRDGDFANEMDVEKTINDTLTDAVFYRNSTVEERLGVEIRQIEQTWGNTWNPTLRNAVLTKSGDYDAAAIYASQSSALATEGIYYNVLDLPYMEFSKPWWNKSIINETELFNTVYFLAGDITISQTSWGVTLFFNKDLFNEFYATQNINLYDEVRAGTWTIDRMYELTSNVWVDQNSDGTLNVGDVYGFQFANSAGDGAADAWVTATGVDITTMVDGYPEITFYDEHTVEAFEKLRKLHLQNAGTLIGNGNTPTEDFIAGNQLFTRQFLGSGKDFRNMSDDYGVVPLPKFDEAQENYRTIAANIASFVVVLSTVENTEKVGAVLELMAAETYKQVTPAFFDTVLKGKYSDSPDDAEMYDKILNSFTYNFGFCYSTVSLGGIGSLFRVLSDDLSQKYETNKIMYQTSLDDLVDKLDEISFVQ
ncbi:MAG: hypothetical protein J6B12_04980 [Clostridia bacterium]|nr:hypothetical protein [Clostridia bacterium]